MNNDTQPISKIDALKQHVIDHKIDVALWCTRALTMFFTFFYIIPIYGTPYNSYTKALAAYAATSALRLHLRQPVVRFNANFLSLIVVEDSFHYLVYTIIFFYVAPSTLVLIPIFCFSLIHFSSYSLQILDIIGLNSMWMARLMISLIEFNARSILNLIAFCEIILMPFCVIFAYTGRASLLIPLMYYRFLLWRYKSQRNPSTMNMFTSLGIFATNLRNKPGVPEFAKSIITSGLSDGYITGLIQLASRSVVLLLTLIWVENMQYYW